MDIDFKKMDGLVPAIIQDSKTLKVLMLGFMNEEALQTTKSTGKVTFWSRTRQCLWTKGETSGNYLNVVEILSDCDNDTLLALVEPIGPTCHTGRKSCFDYRASFLSELEEVINQRVREILRVRFTVSPVAKEVANTKPVGNTEEMAVALEVARRSIVLLKNGNNEKPLLPINLSRVKRIAVVGENAVTKMALGGVGAGVKTRQEITPLEGLQRALNGKAKITYVPGYKSFDRSSRDKRLSPQQPADPKLMTEAVKAAKQADLVIFVAGDNREVETEGSDRKSITLPSGQDELAKALAKANPHIVTVLVAGGPVDVSTVSQASEALLVSWFNGSMGGQALAEVLTGKISPSGKLPMSWPIQLSDVPAYATGTYPQTVENAQGDIFVGLVRNKGEQKNQQLVANYSEEDLVGYRWYDCKDTDVAYPFGYGLSYAQFGYSDLTVSPTAGEILVKFNLTNRSKTDAE